MRTGIVLVKIEEDNSKIGAKITEISIQGLYGEIKLTSILSERKEIMQILNKMLDRSLEKALKKKL